MIDVPIEIQTAGFWMFFFLFAASVAVSYLLAPKPPSAPDIQPGEFTNIPTVEQGTPYHIIFGRPPRFKAVMVLWYGGFRAAAWEDKGGASGYYYYMAFHLGLSHASIDGVKQLWFSDQCFWPTYEDPTTYQSDGATSISISQWNAFGGKYGQGGLALTGNILYGGSSQIQNTTLKAYQDGTSTPYYRGITSIVFDDTSYWGNTTQFPVMDVVLKRTDIHHDGTAMWYIAKAVVDEYYSLNVIHVIRETLTSTIFGRGIPVAKIDSVTFEASADTLYTEGIGISYVYNPDDGSISDFLKKLEAIMDGVIYYNHSDGLYKIKLIREDYIEGNLTVYDEDDFSIVSYTRATSFGVASETIIKYTDIASAKPATAKDDDIAVMLLQGETPVTQIFNYPMITNPNTAAFVAAREQDQASRNPAFIKLSVNRSMYAVQRGDVFKISHPRLTKVGIVTTVVRALTIDRGSLEDGEITIDVVEEVFKDVSAATTPPVIPTAPSGDGQISCSIATINIINETKV